MKVRVIDFETAGTDRDLAQGKRAAICEIGYTDLIDGEKIVEPVWHLVDPGMPIPPTSQAIHHLSDADVAGAMDPGKALLNLMEGMEPGDIFAAHQKSFEQTFFTGGSYPWICTLICSKHLYPDLEGHSNQALRYALDLDQEFEWPELAMPPHRAGPDSYITAHILRRLLAQKTPAELVELTTLPVLQKYVGFGTKHRGQPWSEMDEGFLQWVLDKDFDEETKNTARHHLRRVRQTHNPFSS